MNRDTRMDGADARRIVGFTFDGVACEGREGEPVGMALWAAGNRAMRHASTDGSPRGMLCAMGICFECLVRVDGEMVRSCLTPLREGMDVRSGGKP